MSRQARINRLLRSAYRRMARFYDSQGLHVEARCIRDTVGL